MKYIIPPFRKYGRRLENRESAMRFISGLGEDSESDFYLYYFRCYQDLYDTGHILEPVYPRSCLGSETIRQLIVRGASYTRSDLDKLRSAYLSLRESVNARLFSREDPPYAELQPTFDKVLYMGTLLGKRKGIDPLTHQSVFDHNLQIVLYFNFCKTYQLYW